MASQIETLREFRHGNVLECGVIYRWVDWGDSPKAQRWRSLVRRSAAAGTANRTGSLVGHIHGAELVSPTIGYPGARTGHGALRGSTGSHSH